MFVADAMKAQQRITLILGIITTCNSLQHSQSRNLTSHAAAPGKFGHYRVREGAYTFWWLFPASGVPPSRLKDTPTILWLQGGPGASSTGFGNFETAQGMKPYMQEVGPYEIGWTPRQHSWAQRANLLFVDNPVGTGFSYVTSNDSYATDNAVVAEDLTSFLRQFLDEQEAHDQPFYIFSESYGGKMCAGFAEKVLQEQRKGALKVNLKGIALGDSWISPLDYVSTWGDFLKAWSLLDDYQLSQLAPLILDTQDAVKGGNLTGATSLWGLVEERIGNLTDNVDWYNALMHNIPDTEASNRWGSSLQDYEPGLTAGSRLLRRHHSDRLTDFMRGEVTQRLGVVPEGVQWGSQAQDVFAHLAGDFMADSIASVDALLDAGLPVAIYNGQLDLICSVLGLDAWMPKLRWKGLAAIQAAKPEPIYAFGPKGGRTTGFVRRHDNLSVFIILSAGHMIPSDQPEAALDMVSRIINDSSRMTSSVR